MESRRVALGALIVAVAGVAVSLAVQVWAGLRGMPIRGFDDVMYTSPVIFYANTGKLINPFIQFGDHIRFIWHGWLTPTVLSYLPGAGNPTLVGVTMVAMAVVSTVLFAVLILRRGITWEGAFLIPAIFAAALFNTNRPELVATPLLILALLVLPRLWGREPVFSIGFVLFMGVIGVAHPHVAFLCCFGMGLYLIGQAPSVGWLAARIAIYAVSITAVMAILTQLNPQVGFVDWVTSLYGMATIITGLPAEWKIGGYYFWAPFLLLAVTYIVALFFAGLLIFQRRRQDASFAGRDALLLGGIAAYYLAIVYLCIRQPHLTYLIGIAPPLLWALQIIAQDRQNRARRAAQVLIAVTGLTAAASLAYRTIITEVSARQGVSAQQYSAELSLLGHETGRIGVESALANVSWAALPNAKVVIWPRYDMFPPTRPPADFHTPPPILIVEQSDSGVVGLPRPRPGYRLVVDRFHRDQPSFLGRRIGNTYKDYAYAIFCRTDYCPILAAATAQR